MHPTRQNSSTARNELNLLFRSVREATAALAAPLSDADATVQSMPDASPAKWHLAHTTWFFETLVLSGRQPHYRVFDPHYHFLFNSYYESLGPRHERPRRGLLTRPTLEEILAYREHVDAAIAQVLFEALFEAPSSELFETIELGCHHEQQHQELLLTDILHLFAQNPLHPIYSLRTRLPALATADAPPLGWHNFEGGIIQVGAANEGFAFDCERPRHRVFIEPYRLADRPIVNAEWMDFMEDGGYRNPLLWLSDGWAKVCAEHWSAPLYWQQRDGEYWTMTLSGFRRVDPAEPVAHISYFEADAFARWAKARLPTETEWERATMNEPVEGNFLDSQRLHPVAASERGLRQMFGDVWEWTSSAFAPYPRFRPARGAAGEYNGKFMCGQQVLRGGSCVTPAAHMRASTRNFFPPDARWQFTGLRLAGDSHDP